MNKKKRNQLHGAITKTHQTLKKKIVADGYHQNTGLKKNEINFLLKIVADGYHQNDSKK